MLRWLLRPHPHRRGAVVRRLRLAWHRVNARAVVVRARVRRRRQGDRLRDAPARRQRTDPIRGHLGVQRRYRRVDGTIVAQCRRRRGRVARVAHRRRQRELVAGNRAVVAYRRRPHLQVRMLRWLLRPHPHRRGAVVRRLRLAWHRVNARAVVVRARVRRRRQGDRLRDAPARRQRTDPIRGHLGVQRRYRRVDGTIVAQCRRRRGRVARVAHRRRQRELVAGNRAVVAYRRRPHLQVRMLRWLLRPHPHRRGAVVRRLRLAWHRVHAGAVVKRPRPERRHQRHQVRAAARSRQCPHVVRPDCRIQCRDRRVRRAEITQGRR